MTIYDIICKLSLRMLAVLAVIMTCASCVSYRRQTAAADGKARVVTGAEVLIDGYTDQLKGRSVGLVVNHTARVGGQHLVDALLGRGVNVAAIYAPEHGFRGDAGAGEEVDDSVDSKTGIPIFSLYGDSRKPTPDILKGVDLLIFDIQDVGARCYTYIATLGLVIEAAAEAGIPLWVLDRPNPAGGDYVSGWVREDQFKSFVAPYPIPMAHGLTIGEMARMIMGERWVQFKEPPELTVIPMRGWGREMKWPDTGLKWVAPSPNLPRFDNAFLYLGTVLFEGTSLSEGRGTESPFMILGDPKTAISRGQLRHLRNLSPSLQIKLVNFTPVSIPNAAPNPKHEGALCKGIRVRLLNHDFDPIVVGMQILETLLAATPDHKLLESLYKLSGTESVNAVLSGESKPAQIDFGLEHYLARRKLYLLY